MAIIKGIWTRVKRLFRCKIENPPQDNIQVPVDRDASPSLSRLPAAVAFNQETMIGVPTGTSGPSSSNHQIISKSIQFDNSPDSQLLADMDASASLPCLPAVGPLNQETMVSVSAASNHETISKPIQLEKLPGSQLMQDCQLVADMDATAPLPLVPAVVPSNQETMACVPADGPSGSSHQVIPTRSQFESFRESQLLVDMDTTASLPRLLVQQETMECVPVATAGASSSNHEIISMSNQDTSSSLPCSSTTSRTRWKYDVFLSFRGPDSRKGITSEIRDRLQSRGVRTFMDDPDLQVGDTIPPTLIKAIEESRFAVVVLSPNYASSTWCLEELAKIWECMAKKKICECRAEEKICDCMANEERIFPLFYDVKPAEVRHQNMGTFKEAFSKHETSGRHKPEIVKQWRTSLQGVADISGWSTDDFKTHRELVDKIVESLRSKVPLDATESTDDFQAYEATAKAMDEVKEALRDDEITVVGVFGMGGVGKTTMVTHVAAQACTNGTFNHWIIASISQCPDFTQIQDTLADLLGIELKERTEAGRAARLHKEIMRREKLFIILDDVWDMIELSKIGIPSFKELQTVDSKVLLTTRRWNVCHVMDCQRKIILNILSEQDSWALFVRKARRSFESGKFGDVAKKVAKECGGLPIALVTVARALGDKDCVEWERAAQQLHKSKYANPDDHGKATTCIKLSYDFLKHKDHKSYFLLCCLFPEDYDIPMEELFRYAIGIGLFRDDETLAEARDRADSLARHLKYSSLLMDSRNINVIRMHDVVRDAAIQIAESEEGFLVKAGHGLEGWPHKLHEGYSAISLMRNYICKLPEKLVCPKLQILLLNKNFSLEEIPQTFFQSPNALRALDLSLTSFSSLPQSFDLLANLQALYLDSCDITDISILGKLTKLEILSMRNSGMKELAIEVGGLTNLRIFDNTGGNIGRIPPEVISKWHNLEELYMKGFWGWGSKVGGGGEENKASLPKLRVLEALRSHAELHDLEELDMNEFRECGNDKVGFDEVTSLSKLRVLEASISDAECLPKYVDLNLNLIKFDIHIGGIITGIYEPYEKNVYDGGHHRKNSIFLELDKVSRLPKWFCNDIMKMAERLRWEGCQRLIDIFEESEHGRLQSLKHLHIAGPKEGCIIMTVPRKIWVPKKPVFENLEELHLVGLDCRELCAAEFLPPVSLLFNLKVLEVEDCFIWQNILFPSTLLQKQTYVQEFLVHGTDAGSESMFNPDTVSICKGPAPPAIFLNLESLSITKCNLRGSLFSFDVAQCLSELNCLEIHECHKLERIVEATNQKTILPNLKKLTFGRLPFFKSSTFDIECPSLEHLKLFSLPTATLGHAPPAMFQNLQSMSIQHYRRLRGSLFTYDVGLCLSQLNFLKLDSCPRLERIVEASNKKVILPKLKTLILSEVPKLYYGSATFDTVCPSLGKLSLTGCPPKYGAVRTIDLVDLGICNGPSRLPAAVFQNLQSLSIEWCKSEEYLFTYEVAQCLSHLNSLKLWNCPQLKRIIEATNTKVVFPELKQLSLWYLPMLFYESASFDIVCPSLEELFLRDCAKFSASSSDFHSTKQVRVGWWA